MQYKIKQNLKGGSKTKRKIKQKEKKNNIHTIIAIILTFSYISKKVCAFLIKLSAATKQLIRRNPICCLKNLAIFFTE